MLTICRPRYPAGVFPKRGASSPGPLSSTVLTAPRMDSVNAVTPSMKRALGGRSAEKPPACLARSSAVMKEYSTPASALMLCSVSRNGFDSVAVE